MINNLMSQPPIILQNVIILSTCSLRNLLRYRLRRHTSSQLTTPVTPFEKYKPDTQPIAHSGYQLISPHGTSVSRATRQSAPIRIPPISNLDISHIHVRLTACPWLKGWISRNAKTFSDSKSLKLGISPIGLDK